MKVNCRYCGEETEINSLYPTTTIWKTEPIRGGSRMIYDEKGHGIKIGELYECTECNIKSRIANY